MFTEYLSLYSSTEVISHPFLFFLSRAPSVGTAISGSFSLYLHIALHDNLRRLSGRQRAGRVYVICQLIHQAACQVTHRHRH